VKEASVERVRALEASVLERFHNAGNTTATNADDKRVALTA
jgi:indolepyruvate ferredoxin oxidoreductase